MKPLTTLALCSLLLALPSSAAADDPPRLQIEQLADGVFAFRPTAEAMDGWKAISNSAAVVLDDGVVIYDSHWTPALAEEARALLAAHTDKPIRYVVASHYHGDHTGGAWAYYDDVGAGEIEMISHHATRELLEEDLAKAPDELPAQIAQQEEQIESIEDPVQRDRVATWMGHSRGLLERINSDAPWPLPTLTFDAGVVIHRGRTVEVHFLGRGHTRGDAILLLPEEKIVFLGDLLFHKMLPNVRDGFTREWIETLEKVLELDATRFVPGHGELADADTVRQQIAYLEWLRSAVEPFVSQEAGADAAVEAIALPEEYADYGFSEFLPGSVRKVYEEIEAGR